MFIRFKWFKTLGDKAKAEHKGDLFSDKSVYKIRGNACAILLWYFTDTFIKGKISICPWRKGERFFGHAWVLLKIQKFFSVWLKW